MKDKDVEPIRKAVKRLTGGLFCKHEYEEKERFKKLVCKKCGSEIWVKE